MKKLAILTATRAEYGLLKNIIIKMKAIEELEVDVLVTGAHLSPQYGDTYKEIEADGIEIAKKVDMQLTSDSPSAISKSMALAMIGFTDYFEESKLDALMVLGDRYETLAVCITAMNARIPIIHLYGGETTEGAIDEAIRHSITKMSYLHFTATDAYRKRVIQLGENPDRVFCVGTMGVENALCVPRISKTELSAYVGLSLDKPFGVVTFHPVTLEGNEEKQCRELLEALEEFNDCQFIITGANADAGGELINRILKDFADTHEDVSFIMSLGIQRYLSALSYASFVIGNSSSGLIEAPSFHIPTINIGNRQKGRERVASVIDCNNEKREIVSAIKLSLSEEFNMKIREIQNLYEGNQTSTRIAKITKEWVLGNKMQVKKKFYDLSIFGREKE